MDYERDDTSHILTQLGRFDDAIKAEFDLIGLRMTWLVVSESFIFTAFSIAVSNYRQESSGIVLILPDALHYLIWALPILGMLMASLVYIAIIAAHSAIYRLKNQRDGMTERLPLHLMIRPISRGDIQHRLGNIPPWGIPPLLFLAWALALCVLRKS